MSWLFGHFIYTELAGHARVHVNEPTLYLQVLSAAIHIPSRLCKSVDI